MTPDENKSLDAMPSWITAVLWSGVVIVVVSFLAVISVLGYYFADATPATWIFWLALLAFPTGFIFLLVALVSIVIVRRKRQHS